MAMHLYLSPHLDDAVLSVGGLLATQLRAAERAVVATICTADPATGEALSPLAIELHRQWGGPTRPCERRRQKEIRACRVLGGAELCHLGLRDAIYRGPATCALMAGVANARRFDLLRR